MRDYGLTSDTLNRGLKALDAGADGNLKVVARPRRTAMALDAPAVRSPDSRETATCRSITQAASPTVPVVPLLLTRPPLPRQPPCGSRLTRGFGAALSILQSTVVTRLRKLGRSSLAKRERCDEKAACGQLVA